MSPIMNTIPSRPVWNVAATWTEAEKAAWKAIEDHWDYLTKGDVEKFLSHIHPKFTGFGHESPLLIDKASLQRWVGFWIKSITIPVYELQPVYAAAYDNFAILHYYIFALEKGEKSAMRTIRRYTTTLIKENGKWLILGNQNQLLPGDW